MTTLTLDPFTTYFLGMALGGVLGLSGVHLLDLEPPFGTPRHKIGVVLIVVGGLCAIAGATIFLGSMSDG